MASTDLTETGAAGTSRSQRRSLVDHPPSSELAFPGCRPVRLPREKLETWDGRLEFWDGATETAWVCEPNSPYHEKPGRALPSLVERIAAVRGSPITCYGSMDLMVRDGRGLARRILQADESVYLHPGRARLPGAVAMEVGEHDLPDVVLEVDHTTDVYRGKLRLYEAWGFPEVWVEVPNYRAASRPKRRRAGLTIHVLEGDVYQVSPESRAFPGWSAKELHVSFNEKVRSARTCAVLERVGTALGTREGTGPDDDPMLRSLRGRSREEGEMVGKTLGRMEGRAEGERKGRAEGLGGDPGEDGAPDPALAGAGGFPGVPDRPGVRRVVGGCGVRGGGGVQGRDGAPCRTASAAQPG